MKRTSEIAARADGATTVAVIVAAALGLLLVVGWFTWARCGLRGCPDVELVKGYVPEEASVVLDRDGEEITKLYRVMRVVVELEDLPEHVPAAFVAAEDRRFWDHRGVDWRRLVGAAVANLRRAEVGEGGSTITMQLARNIFPDELPQTERTLRRKLAEMRVARQIEKGFTKEEILGLYLNQIYFGSGAWGIEAASREYFGKAATELALGEAALLAGVIPAPSRLNPRRDLEAARRERNSVLRRMQRQGMIGEAEASTVSEEEVRLARSTLDPGQEAPYFVEEVRQIMEELLGERVYTGGLRIHTTLDRATQEAAERSLESQLQAIESGRFGAYRQARYSPDATDAAYLQGAVVVMDARTGDVTALVGGRDFGQSKFNRATQAMRQPGSAFKPFVYAAGVAAGYPPVHALEDTPLQLTLDGGRTWTPRNYGGSYGGRMTMRDALVQSRNVATVRLAQEVGLGQVIRTATRLGITSPLPTVPSISIGAAEVRVLELTAAFSAFATLGERAEPRLVTRVEDRAGRVLWETVPRTERVIDPAVAFIVLDMMRDVVDRGTGSAVRAAGFGAPAAGKTGTTNDNTDVWFVGMTPRTVAGVWIGFDRPARIVPGATGGALAAPVWARVMNQVGSGGSWSPPPGVETRAVAGPGIVVAPDCPVANGARQEYFLAGTAPVGVCGRLDELWREFLGEDNDFLGEPAEPDSFPHLWDDPLAPRPELEPLDPDSPADDPDDQPDQDEPPELLGEPVDPDTMDLDLPAPPERR